MRKKKILSAIVAFSMAASMSSLVVSEADTREYRMADLVGLINYILNSDQSSGIDLNNDGAINVIDVLWMKSAILGDIDFNAKQYDITKLNQAAETLYKEAQRIAYLCEINNEVLSDHVYSSDRETFSFLSESERNFYIKVSDIAEKNNIKNWCFSLEDYVIRGVVTGSDDLNASGVYPNMISQKENIPYSDEKTDLLEYASGKWFYTDEELRSYISSNPFQASLPDYPIELLLKLRKENPKDLFSNLQILSQEYEDMGIELNGIYNSEFPDDLVNAYYEDYGYGDFEWKAEIKDNKVLGVVCRNKIDSYCGTYPNMIPQKYNIPFKDANIDLIKYASGECYIFDNELSQYISSDPLQASLPDYPADVLLELRISNPEKIFIDLQTLAEKYETKGIVVNGTYCGDSPNDFVNEFNKNTDCNCRWKAEIKDNVVSGVVCQDIKDSYCATYPNRIPQKYNIPFENETSDMLKFASGEIHFRDEELTGYISSDPWQASLPDYPINLLLSSRNSNSKKLFTELQTLAQEYETQGTLVDGIYYSYSSDDFVKAYNDKHGYEDIEWIAKIKDNVVLGVLSRQLNDLYCGAYPNTIPYTMNVPLQEIFISNAVDTDFKWDQQLPEYITDDEEQKGMVDDNLIINYKVQTLKDNYGPELKGIIKLIRRYMINTADSNAKSIFTNASTMLQEEETKGVNIPDGIYTEDDNSEFIKGVRDSFYDTNNGNCKWAVMVSSGQITGAVYSEGGFCCTGAYPSPVPSRCNIEYNPHLVQFASDIDYHWENK